MKGIVKFFGMMVLATSLAAGQTVLSIPPVVTAESAIIIDSASGKILWSRNSDEELYPASTTKIMTALLLLDHCKPDEIITAPQDVMKVKESSMHLKPGEKVRAKDMLYALMLRSANDGCYAVAVHIAGSVDRFSDMMNRRAIEIGCTHTHFHNPNGLNDPLHYTTAHDLALIGREAMKYEPFRDIVRTTKTKINRGTNWQDLWMTNHNLILRKDPTCEGIKTGWTIPAGHCFVGCANRNDWRVITVVMKSKNWEADTEGLFSWAFANYEKHQEVKTGDVCASLPVKGSETTQETVIAQNDAYTLTRKGSPFTAAFRLVQIPPDLTAPVPDRAQVGKLLLKDADGFSQEVPLVTSGPVLESKFHKAKENDGGKIFAMAGIIVGAIYVRGLSRKKITLLSN